MRTCLLLTNIELFSKRRVEAGFIKGILSLLLTNIELFSKPVCDCFGGNGDYLSIAH